MLVLSRKIGERIVIDDEVTISVVSVNGGKVRLGIEAPDSVPVWRAEIAGAIHDSTAATSQRQRLKG